MTRFTVPKSHVPPQPRPVPDTMPLPVEPDKGPTPDLLPDDPSREGIIQPVALQRSATATV